MRGSGFTRTFSGTLRRPLAMGACAVLLAVSLSACEGRVAARGNLPDADRLAEIKPGEVTRDEVAEILGTPSTVATFGDEAWFYVSELTETVAFLAPAVRERKVVIVLFDQKGVVTGVETKGLDAAVAVSPVGRKTPTVGKELTVLEQLVGNFNRLRNKNK